MVKPSEFIWLDGEDYVGRFELEGAEEFATSFCRNCGSSLPWLAKSGTVMVIPAGTLDGDPEMRPNQSIYCGSRAVWYIEPSALPEHAELPPRKR